MAIVLLEASVVSVEISDIYGKYEKIQPTKSGGGGSGGNPPPQACIQFVNKKIRLLLCIQRSVVFLQA